MYFIGMQKVVGAATMAQQLRAHTTFATGPEFSYQLPAWEAHAA